MSPEQTRGQPLGPQSDLFSLGTVLYEALSGERALPQADRGDAFPPPLPLAPSQGTSPELHAIVEALLALDPAQRPSSAATAGARFRTWLAQRHPEGVASALGQRAEQARARAAQHADKPAVAIEGGSSATPHLTRSIATSAQLAELLHERTEPLERKPAPAAEPSPRGRRLRWLLPSLFAAFAAALLLQRSMGPRYREARTPAHPAQPAHAPQPLQALPPARPPEPAAAPEGASPSEPAASGTAPAAGHAHLSVNALPWAQLRLDGRTLGVTPQRALSVSVGAHLLELDCPPLGRKARVPLKLNAGDHPHVLVDLNASPPQVSVR
jgi:serine/threonine-protein kinase